MIGRRTFLKFLSAQAAGVSPGKLAMDVVKEGAGAYADHEIKKLTDLLTDLPKMGDQVVVGSAHSGKKIEAQSLAEVKPPVDKNRTPGA